MWAYVLGIVPFLLQFINLNEMNVKEAAFADEFSIAAILNSIKDYRDKLTAIKTCKILSDRKKRSSKRIC